MIKCPKCGSKMINEDYGLMMDVWFCKNEDCYNSQGIKGYLLSAQQKYQARLDKVLEKFREYDDQQYSYECWLNYDREENNFWFVTESGDVIQNLSIETVESILKDLEK